MKSIFLSVFSSFRKSIFLKINFTEYLLDCCLPIITVTLTKIVRNNSIKIVFHLYLRQTGRSFFKNENE